MHYEFHIAQKILCVFKVIVLKINIAFFIHFPRKRRIFDRKKSVIVISEEKSSSTSIFIFWHMHKKRYWNSINFRFLHFHAFGMHLYAFKYPEHNLTIFGKCLSVYLLICKCVWEGEKFSRSTTVKTNEQNLMKFYV